MKNKQDVFKILKQLEGLQTIESIARALDIKKRTAINLVSKLRKKGYVKYFSAGRKKRIYSISTLKTRLNGNPGLYETINNYSKIKVLEPHKEIVHNRKLSLEKAVVLALKEQNFRLILASMFLFKHIRNWKLLNEEARKESLQRQIGALYDLSRKFLRARRMDKRTRKSLLNGKGNRFIFGRIKTKAFFDIAKKWEIEIPFTEQDLIRLKTG